MECFLVGQQLFPSCRSGEDRHKITYIYGDEEKKDRKRNIHFIKNYFPQARIHGIPKMAHAELVMIYPEEFCRYMRKFLSTTGGTAHNE